MVRFGVLDKAFSHIEKYRKTYITLVLVALAVAFWFQTNIQNALRPIEPFLKLLALVLGPLATVLGFYLSYRAKLDLAVTSESLGKQRATAEKAQYDLADATAKLSDREARLKTQDAYLRSLSEGASDLWRLRPATPFPEYRQWMRAHKGAKILCIGNLKGGVGKTTIAGNLAAYVSHTLKKNVLLIDLDYQGSLSGMMLQACDIPDVESRVERLLEPDASLATVSANRLHLANKMSRGWIVPANYTFATRENQLLFQYVIDDSSGIDLRFRLARALLHPDVRQEYDLIIIDMPPRLTLGTVNALFASHYLLVPTILDKLSGEAVQRFIAQVRSIQREGFGGQDRGTTRTEGDQQLDLQLAGVIACMTKSSTLAQGDKALWDLIGEAARDAWNEDREFQIGTIPRRAAISNHVGDEIPYLLGLDPDSTAAHLASGDALRNDLDPVFRRICEQIGIVAAKPD